MHEFVLRFQEGHLFVSINGDDWLLDTGAPTSFGTKSIEIEGRNASVPDSYMGLDAVELSGYVDHPTAGIIGADVLQQFDLLIDVKSQKVSFSTEQLAIHGEVLETAEFMGIPIVQAEIGGTDRRMFFDTGAQISYFQDASLDTFPAAGSVTDFFPGIGQFQTNTYQVIATLGSVQHELRCGALPGLLGMTLMMAGTEGIIGNEILRERVAGYFPRRRMLVLA